MSMTSFDEQPTGIPFDSTDYAMNCAYIDAAFVLPATPCMEEWEEEDGEMGVEVDIETEEIKEDDDELFEQYMLGDDDD